MKTCKNSLGNVIGYFLVPNYSHIMSDKIRQHLIKRYWEGYGLKAEGNKMVKI